LKIAFVADNVYPYYIGGIEKRVWELGRRLVKRGHEVHHYCLRYWDGPEVLCVDGVFLHGVCTVGELYVNGRRSIKTAGYFALRSFEHLLGERFDIIDCQNSPYLPVITSKMLQVLTRTRLVVTWHEVWGKYWYTYLGKLGFAGLFTEYVCAKLSKDAITVSTHTRDNLLRIGLKEDCIEIIPNGVDFNDICSTEGCPEKTDIIYAGRLMKEKCVDTLLCAVSTIRKSRPDVKCLIVGQGPERDQLCKLTEELDLCGNVIFRGFYPDYKQLIARIKSSTVLVLPSFSEGFGIIALEANACGVPVITSSSEKNAAKDLISHGHNGLIFDTTTEDLSGQIMKILDSSRDRWISPCLQIAKHYDWDNIVDNLEQYYNRLVVK
jgi:glycosyltransferase involved in cell wall biosynthesis